jgi:molybdenum cofactor biosynthesis protein MoaC
MLPRRFGLSGMKVDRRDKPPLATPYTPMAQSLRRLYSSVSGHQPHLTHIDSAGRASMVNVADKTPTKRSATATGRIFIPQVAYELIIPSCTNGGDGTSTEETKTKVRGKGDVLTIAQLAAIMGAKRTSDLIPLCHPLALSHVSVMLTPEIHQCDDSNRVVYSIFCRATVACEGKTGVEMEALTAVSVGALTVWDMLKAVAGKEMIIGDITVTRKEGGKDGDFVKEQETT